MNHNGCNDIVPFYYQVCYGDTDAGGIVYHARYLEMAERSRNHLMCQFGLCPATLPLHFGVLFVVTKAMARYRAPAYLDDYLTLTSRLVSITPVRLHWLTSILSGGKLLCTVQTEQATLCAKLKTPITIPENINLLLNIMINPLSEQKL